MTELSIEQMPDINNENCFYCGKELTNKNKSAWVRFDMVNGEQVGVNVCVVCNEAYDRMLVGAKKTNNGFVPVKTYEQCIKQMRAEGITEGLLKELEEAQLNVSQ